MVTKIILGIVGKNNASCSECSIIFFCRERSIAARRCGFFCLNYYFWKPHMTNVMFSGLFYSQQTRLEVVLTFIMSLVPSVINVTGNAANTQTSLSIFHKSPYLSSLCHLILLAITISETSQSAQNKCIQGIIHETKKVVRSCPLCLFDFHCIT